MNDNGAINIGPADQIKKGPKCCPHPMGHDADPTSN